MNGRRKQKQKQNPVTHQMTSISRKQETMFSLIDLEHMVGATEVQTIVKNGTLEHTIMANKGRKKKHYKWF